VKNNQPLSLGNVLPIVFIFLIALVLRLIYIVQINGTPLAVPAFTVDSGSYIEFALRMLRGDYFFKEITYQSPLYPFFLLSFFKMFGQNLMAARLMQAILDAMVCVLIFALAARLSLRKSFCWLGALIYAFYGIAIFYTGLIIDTTLSIFLYTVFIFLLERTYSQHKSMLWFLTGCFAALAILTKPFLILFVLFFAIGHLGQRQDPSLRQRLKNLFMLCLGLLMILAPLSLRHYQINKTLSPLQAYGGFRFFRANHPGAGGGYSSVPGLPDAPILEIQSAIHEAERVTGKKMDAGSVSRFWFQKSFEFISKQPDAFLKGLASKVFLFWNWREVGDNIDYAFNKSFASLLQLPLFSFGMIAPFGLLGCYFALLKRSPSIRLMVCFLVCYMTAVVLFDVTDRFRLPCVPLIIILGVFSIGEFLIAFRSHHLRKVIVAMAILGLSLLFVHQQTIPGKVILSQSYEGNIHYNLGIVYESQKRFSEALQEYQKASVLAPEHLPARHRLAGLYENTGEFKKAYEEYQKLLVWDAGNADIYNRLGMLFLKMGKPDDAISFFHQAILLKQDFAVAYHNLGVTYAAKKQFENAMAAYRKAIELDPLFNLPRQNLVGLYQQSGQSEKASDELRQAALKSSM